MTQPAAMDAPRSLPPPLPLLVARRATRNDEVEDLVGLLLDHACSAAGGAAEIARVADAVALASLGDNHLWQDLQLPDRGALTALMRHWFPPLAAKNCHDMKWKKFLYKQLCDKAALSICRAPTCGVCADYAACYGPEDAVPA